MNIEYDPHWVEQVVFLATRERPELERELHAEIDPLYAGPDARAREAGFHRVFVAWFSRLGLDRVLADLLAERPLIAEHVGTCVIREAARSKTESAELLVRRSDTATGPADRKLVVQVCPPSLLDPDRLVPLMRRELLHVSDMLDAGFAYRPDSVDGLPARQNLVRDRFRVLWDVYSAGRLSREGRPDAAYARRLRALLGRAFQNRHSIGAGRPGFERVFNADVLTQRQLLDWAEHPETLFDEDADRGPATRQAAGETCPLCGFPTHDWFAFAGGDADLLATTLRSDYPGWETDKGACRQCAETYLAAGAQATQGAGHRRCRDEDAQPTDRRPSAGGDLSGLHLSDRRGRVRSGEGP